MITFQNKPLPETILTKFLDCNEFSRKYFSIPMNSALEKCIPIWMKWVGPNKTYYVCFDICLLWTIQLSVTQWHHMMS